MFKKEEKNKVGRPKLADNKLKKESILICAFVIVTLAIFAFLGFNIITISFNSKYLVGTVYNDHVNTCKIENDKIDCGPNVTYMKYSTDGKNYKEVVKEDNSINVKVDNAHNVKVCYKKNNDNDKLNCIN